MREHNGLLVEMVTNGPFVENCFLVADKTTRDAIVIDPGDEEGRIQERVQQLRLSVREIVNTHGHVDHAGAVEPLKRMLGVPFAMHASDQPWLDRIAEAAMMFGLPPKQTPKVDRELTDEGVVKVGQFEGRVLHTPGHTAGGCCVYFADAKVVFVGDTLFAGSIGRTDLPGGSLPALLGSIRQKLLTLQDDVVVYSGHGPETTIGEERQSNPFLRGGPMPY